MLGADNQIRDVELILNVPTHSSIVSPFLNNSMEETETKKQTLEDGPRFSSRIESILFDQIGLIETDQVGFDSLWSLNNDLDSCLQERGGEVVRWIRGQPETELWVGVFVTDDLLPDGGQVGEPGGQKVTVLEDNPVSTLGSFNNHFLCHCSLALTK